MFLTFDLQMAADRANIRDSCGVHPEHFHRSLFCTNAKILRVASTPVQHCIKSFLSSFPFSTRLCCRSSDQMSGEPVNDDWLKGSISHSNVQAKAGLYTRSCTYGVCWDRRQDLHFHRTHLEKNIFTQKTVLKIHIEVKFLLNRLWK